MPGSESHGQRLARIRKALGITQVDLARRLGISQPVLSDYERGRLRLHGNLIVHLTRELGVSADQLLGLKAIGSSRRRNRRLDQTLLHRLERISLLPLADKKALIRTIDAYLHEATPTG